MFLLERRERSTTQGRRSWQSRRCGCQSWRSIPYGCLGWQSRRCGRQIWRCRSWRSLPFRCRLQNRCRSSRSLPYWCRSWRSRPSQASIRGDHAEYRTQVHTSGHAGPFRNAQSQCGAMIVGALGFDSVFGAADLHAGAATSPRRARVPAPQRATRQANSHCHIRTDAP
jgi:hypothetical protein